jgi:hypothetical protein
LMQTARRLASTLLYLRGLSRNCIDHSWTLPVVERTLNCSI